MLSDYPPHSCSLYSAASSQDDGGGTVLAYTLAQADLPCSINTASSSTRRDYGQDQVTVTHTVSFQSATLTVTCTRGMKVVDDQSNTFIVRGIRSPCRPSSYIIPALTYLDCEQVFN